MRTQLLCTFTKRNALNETIENIKNTYNISFGKIYVLEDKNNKRDLICTYNIESEKIPGETLRHTISIHRKKQTNTLYTINALNYIVSMMNDGVVDPNVQVEWENYRETLLLANNEGFKKIETKLFQVIEI